MCSTCFLCRVLVGGLGYLAAVHGADIWTTEVHAFALFCDHCLVYDRGWSINNGPNRYVHVPIAILIYHILQRKHMNHGVKLSDIALMVTLVTVIWLKRLFSGQWKQLPSASAVVAEGYTFIHELLQHLSQLKRTEGIYGDLDKEPI
jgi:hypothetical protein